MDLRQLEYAVAIADLGSFTAAAAGVHTSQPSISHGIRTLEAELGVDLFFRHGRTVSLTPAGEAIVGVARRVLRDAATVRSIAADMAGGHLGRVDVVTLPTLAAEPVAPLVGRLRLQHPDVSVRVTEPEGEQDLLDDVASGRAEVGFTDLGAGAGGLTAVELFEQELLLIAPPETGLGARAVAPAALARQRFVVTPAGTSTRRLLDRVVPNPVVAVEIDQRDAIVPLVLAGAGSALVPAPVALEAGRRGATVASLRPRVTRPIGLLHRPGAVSPAAAALVALAQATLRQSRRRPSS